MKEEFYPHWIFAQTKAILSPGSANTKPMKQLTFLFLFVVLCSPAFARHARPHRDPQLSPRRAGRVFIKWTPTAIAGFYSGPGLQFGLEGGLANNVGVGLDVAWFPPFRSFRPSTNGGIGIYPELRIYQSSWRHSRLFIGAQGLYRKIDFGSGQGTFIRDHEWLDFTQTSSASTVFGGPRWQAGSSA